MSLAEEIRNRKDSNSNNVIIYCENSQQIDFIKRLLKRAGNKVRKYDNKVMAKNEKDIYILIQKYDWQKDLIGLRFRDFIDGYDFEKILETLN